MRDPYLKRVMFIGGQEHGVERTVNIQQCRYIHFMKVPHNVQLSLDRDACLASRNIVFEEITYRLHQVSREMWVAVYEDIDNDRI